MGKRVDGSQPGASVHELRHKVDRVLNHTGSIDQHVFLLDLIECFGGPRKLAVAMHEEFQNAPRGGLARQKFLQMVQHLIISCTQSSQNRLGDPSQYNDDELNTQLHKYMTLIKDDELVAPFGGAEESAEIPGLEAGEDDAAGDEAGI
jgi:hypothetical protein